MAKNNQNKNMAKNNQNKNQNQEENANQVKANQRPDDSKETKAELKKEIFISKYRELRLVVKSAYSKEVDGRIVTYQGKSIQFHDGMFETEDPEEIKFLEGHKNFGNTFVKAYSGDARKERENKYKDLDTREKELKATIARLQDENKRLKDEKENAEKSDDDPAGDGATDGEGGKDGESAAY